MKSPLYITDNLKNYYLIVDTQHALVCNFLHEIALRANKKELEIITGMAHPFYILMDGGIVLNYHVGKLLPSMQGYTQIGWLFVSELLCNGESYYSDLNTKLLTEVTRAYGLDTKEIIGNIKTLLEDGQCNITYENIGLVILTNYGMLYSYKEINEKRVLVPLVTIDDVYMTDGKVSLHLLDKKTLVKYLLQRRLSGKELQLAREFYVST